MLIRGRSPEISRNIEVIIHTPGYHIIADYQVLCAECLSISFIGEVKHKRMMTLEEGHVYH